MATTYTHQRFADECAKALSGDALRAVERRRGLYITGAHGPDILFYYHAPLPGRVSALGSRLHRESARGFFENARLVWNTHADVEGMLAYLLGFLTHFALDSSVHGFVNGEHAALGVSHNRLEAVWDARLMLRDGLRPSGVFRGAELEPTAENAALIAPFFGLTAKRTLAALRGQERVMRLLYAPDERKRRALRAAIRLSRLPGGFDDLFIDDEIPPELDAALDELDARYAAALAEFPGMASALRARLEGKAELPERFDRDFE